MIVIAKDFAGAAGGLSAVPASLSGQAPAMESFPASRRPLNRCLVPTQFLPDGEHVLDLHFRVSCGPENVLFNYAKGTWITLI